MTSPAGPPEDAGSRGDGDTGDSAGTGGQRLKLLAVTACPTGIAHTYMAAERLTQAARALGHEIKVETQGAVGAENVLTSRDIEEADGIVVAADKDVDLGRFDGKRVLVTGVTEGIDHPERLIERVRTAPVHRAGRPGRRRPWGVVGYRALMTGVSYMIPFVVVGGLLIAVSLALGGHPGPSGLVLPEGSLWQHLHDIGGIGFTLMLPVLSGYIAYAVADRTALVPGMAGGWLADHGALYDSRSGAGFIGAIATGFLAGWLVLGIRRIAVPGFVRPIMPIIVIPVAATSALGLFFVYVLGQPVSWVFERLTDWLGGLTGASVVVLGVLVGLMIAFDMGGPVNKTAFLFAAGLIPRNPEVMGMCAVAIPVPPLGQGLATLLRRGLFRAQEREAGLAALFMGLFGLTEGAIPFAAARPARVIPANMLGGGVAGAVAGLGAVTDGVPHGGPVVAALGVVGGVPMFLIAVAVGTVVTGLATVTLMSLGRAAPSVSAPVPAVPARGGDGRERRPAAPSPARSAEPAAVLSGRLDERTVRPWLAARDKEEAIRELTELLAEGGGVTDVDALVADVLRREGRGTTGFGAGVAIPHAWSDAVEAPVVAFARSEAGVAWGSPDGTAARLLFLIAVPRGAAADEHLRILAALARRLMDPGFRRRLTGAVGVGAILGVLSEIR
ncbi:fructose-specific PTS transporter subunit EIIC [Streptomyces sp. AV19]|uniref:fructose-specific PTS transporter subunit EIIC n=1 Tax=Streptomyces sp. AV19 TaxID=2793068 RepID=UPI0024130E91|nr:fructose-specific PTS transporter subunit EIIC [Streptomyces sp. AV19]MDG4531390.1 fructose-specific PTS transporter subunit EIIC [Streptomyces sp. AV19]